MIAVKDLAGRTKEVDTMGVDYICVHTGYDLQAVLTIKIETTSVQQAIESRHSIRKYIQQPIDREDLINIFELVRLSRSAWNLQPWRFHVVINQDLKQKLENAAYGQKQVTSAPAVIVVTSDIEDVLANLSETVHPNLSEARKEKEESSQFVSFL